VLFVVDTNDVNSCWWDSLRPAHFTFVDAPAR
jgi:hypothetical protein